MADSILSRLRPGVRRAQQQADAARDRKDWTSAAQLYEEAVRLDPQAGPVWVQLGHAQKEAGNRTRAEEAYLRARALRPGDMDVPLQLGHLYKTNGDLPAALVQYQVALDGGLEDPHARHFVVQAASGALVSRASAVAAQTPSAALVFYFDYSDLVAYFRHNRFPTGIQRVQIEFFKASLLWTGPTPIRGCAYSQKAGFWVGLDPAHFGALCNLASRPGDAQDAAWQAALQEVTQRLETGKPLSFPPGSVLVNVGTSWWMPGYMSLIREGRAKYGLRYVPLIYDLIPLITPEYVASDLVSTFAAWASGVFMHADAVGAISACTSRDVTRFAASVRPLDHPPVVVPLDAEFGNTGPVPSATERDLALGAFALRRGGFVLCVSTLEARKNHLLLFQGWVRLVALLGTDATPALVCVGKPGWQFDQIAAYLESQPALADKVLMLSGVSDIELYTLYEECLFTVYASFYEGWGLPVTESLCHGKVCLAANHSSLPEAGGQFATYFDIDSPSSFTDAAYRLIGDPAWRAEREALIAAGYRPRSWLEVLTGFASQLTERLAAAPKPAPLAAPVTLGTQYQFGWRTALRQLDRATAVVDMLQEAAEWHPVEAWGTWTRQRSATLTFTLPQPARAEDVLIYLDIRLAHQPVALTIRLGAIHLLDVPLLAPWSDRMVQVVLPAPLAWAPSDSARRLVLKIEASVLSRLREVSPSDLRDVGFGLKRVAFCTVGDGITRVAMMERTVMLVV